MGNLASHSADEPDNQRAHIPVLQNFPWKEKLMPLLRKEPDLIKSMSRGT